MNSTVTFLAGLLAATSMAVSGYFASSQVALQNRVVVVETTQAAETQKLIDIDTRLTRIENKIDLLAIKTNGK